MNRVQRFRVSASWICLFWTLSVAAQAEGPQKTLPAPQPTTAGAPTAGASAAAKMNLPDAPLQQTSDPQSAASIGGIVVDPSGAVIPGAKATLALQNSSTQRTATTVFDGSFSFNALEPGTFAVTISARGFASWKSPSIVLNRDEVYELPQIQLRVATTMDVEVFSSQTAIAQQEVHAEEKQRVLGVIPNFYTSYVWNAAPLTSKQKFGLAIRSEIDPVSFLGAAVGAAFEQSQRDYEGYGQGAQGFAKRFGASYVDGFDSAILGSAILPSILHQDPRYFWKGTGTIRQRALYAISTVVICKGDNGKWQPNYSNVLGNLAAGGLSNIYYPPRNRGALLTIDTALLGTAAEAIGDLMQEFVLRKVSSGVPAGSSGAQP